MEKKLVRLRRACKIRSKIRELHFHRLCVYRSNSHIYAQIIDGGTSFVLVTASSVEACIRGVISNGGNIKAAAIIGKLIAERARAKGIKSVAFDRSGFRYHGRVKTLAEAAREGGLKF